MPQAMPTNMINTDDLEKFKLELFQKINRRFLIADDKEKT